MVLAISDAADSYVQFMTILIIFLFVLFITWCVTRWIAGYQKKSGINANMEIVETFRLANGKYLQIIRVGKKYLAVAVGKDTVTMLTEIPKEDLCLPDGDVAVSGFKDILDKIQKRNTLEKEDRRDE